MTKQHTSPNENINNTVIRLLQQSKKILQRGDESYICLAFQQAYKGEVERTFYQSHRIAYYARYYFRKHIEQCLGSYNGSGVDVWLYETYFNRKYYPSEHEMYNYRQRWIDQMIRDFKKQSIIERVRQRGEQDQQFILAA